MNKRVWNFPAANHGPSLGYSGDGADQFSNYPLNNLAREIIQNSLDAKRGSEPVIVEFHHFTTEANELPGLDSLLDYILRLSNQKNKAKNTDPKEKMFVQTLISSLNEANKHNKIRWLRISDYNTTGLWGSSTPANKDTAWFAFIHGAGKNQKGEKSGGSRGQGKNSIFINSALKAMYVSTFAKNTEENREERANTGVVKLLSLMLDEEDPVNPDYTQGVGYCVEDNKDAKKYNSPTPELLEIDPEFSREEMGYGTDVYLPCFNGDSDWDTIIEVEAILSFMPAIVAGDLKVIISYDNTTVKHEIYRGNISPYLIGKERNKKEAKAILNVLTSTNTKKIPFTDKPGYEMTLYLLQDNIDGLNAVYEYRLPTKMKIRREYKDSSVGYTGVLFVEGDEISKRLRSIEDATHSNWYIGKHRESGFEKKELEDTLSILDNFISTECQKFGTTGTQEAIYFDVDGWNKETDIYDLSVEESKECGLPSDEVVFDMKNDVEKNPRRKHLKKKGDQIDDDGSAEANVLDIGDVGVGKEEYSHPTGHNDKDGGEIHTGNEQDPFNPNDDGQSLVMARRRIATVNARMPSICPEEGMFDLVFKPEKTGTDAHIEILKVGIDGENEKTSILSAKMYGDALPIVNNKIVMDKIVKNTEYRIHLKLDEKSNYIWEVNVDAED